MYKKFMTFEDRWFEFIDQHCNEQFVFCLALSYVIQFIDPFYNNLKKKITSIDIDAD